MAEEEVITMRRGPGMTEEEWVEAKREATKGMTVVAITTVPGIYSSCTMTLAKGKPKKAAPEPEEPKEEEPKSEDEGVPEVAGDVAPVDDFTVVPDPESQITESEPEPSWDEFLSDLATDVIATIQGGDYTVEELVEMRTAEEGGKNRSTILNTIDHKITSAE